MYYKSQGRESNPNIVVHSVLVPHVSQPCPGDSDADTDVTIDIPESMRGKYRMRPVNSSDKFSCERDCNLKSMLYFTCVAIIVITGIVLIILAGLGYLVPA